MAKLPWTKWHEVAKLRGDLLSGDLPLHMFAADLYEVMMQSGKRPIYEKPKEFFALTFPTHNLRILVRDAMLRLAGKNDKAVRQLELTYGGGKTHASAASWHPCSPANRRTRRTSSARRSYRTCTTSSSASERKRFSR